MAQKKQYIFGTHSVSAILQKQPERLLHLYFQKDKQDSTLLSLAKNYHIKTSFLNRTELDRMSENGVHQGIIAECMPAKTYSENDLDELVESLTEPAFLLILDGVQDPHNLGACLRSADAAGVHAVIAPKDKSASITPTVSKVASGAAETIPFIQITNLARTIRELKDKNIWVFGAAGEATKTLYQANLKVPLAIVMGAEGQGLRRLTREHCDELLNIPMQGSVSSLNVSVATGIFLFEALRQRS